MSQPQNSLPFKSFDAETWLAKRVAQLLAAAFSGDTEIALRKARFRRAILAGGIDLAIAGKAPSGKTETVSELFERIYGEPLTPKPPKGK